MSQLPTILPTQGLKAPANTSVTPGLDEAVDSGGQTEVSAFADAVQEALEAAEDNPFAGLGLALSLPLQPTTLPQCRPGGSSVPLAAIANGTELPPYRQLSSAPQTELSDSLGLKDLKFDSALQNIRARTEQIAPLFTALPSAQAVLAAREAQGDEDFSARFGLTGMPTHSPAAGRAGQFVPPLEMPVGQPGWDKAVGERIQWMIGQHIQSAEVKLTPPHLGPLEIRISVQHDQASVSFMAANLPTREALEAAIPRLREMFGETNLNLVDVGVGQGGSSDAQSQHHSAAGGNARIADATTGLMPSDSGMVQPGRMLGNGLVDDYA